MRLDLGYYQTMLDPRYALLFENKDVSDRATGLNRIAILSIARSSAPGN